MKKKEQGILTVEASIVLTLFLLFVLFLFSFARMYRAQNMISHATMQSADALALESYIREVAHDEDASEIVKLGNQLSGLASLSEESFTSLRAADIPKLAKEKFAVAISSSETNADAILKKLGVKGGLSGVDFSVSKMDLNSNDVIVYANYTLELQFPVFGFSEINVTKAAKAKTFGDILFEISTISNDDRKGTASGGGSYKHGTTIEITAEPKYGYYFDGWDDDGDGDVDYDGGKAITASKRTVTVTDAKTYTAIFKNNGFGVNASVNPEGIEGITIVPEPNAQGLHEYGSKVDITVSHNNSHYTFSGWSGQLLQDKDGDGFEEPVSSIPNPKNNLTYTIPEVQGNYHLTANFTPKQYNVSVSVKDDVGGTAVISEINKTSTKVTYPNAVSLTATPAEGYAVDYWMKNGSKIQSSDGQTTISNEQITGDTNYTVVFKSIRVSVTFRGPDKETLQVITLTSGQSFNDAKITVPSYDGINGKGFNGWIGFKGSDPVMKSITVDGNWITPSISISASEVGHHSITFTATTVPPNAKVNWSHNRNSKNYTITVDSSNDHKATLTINDDNLNYDDFAAKTVVDKWEGAMHIIKGQTHTTVTVTASLNMDSSKKQSKTLTIEPTVEVYYYLYRTYKTSSTYNYRHYYNYALDDPWSTSKWDPDYNSKSGIFFRTWNVPYSQYSKAGTVAKNGGEYAGNSSDKNKQNGTNKGNVVAIKIKCPKKYMGGYDSEVLAYKSKIHGDKKGNGYYDYYISAVK